VQAFSLKDDLSCIGGSPRFDLVLKEEAEFFRGWKADTAEKSCGCIASGIYDPLTSLSHGTYAEHILDLHVIPFEDLPVWKFM
jgi:hypothetical protein